MTHRSALQVGVEGEIWVVAAGGETGAAKWGAATESSYAHFLLPRMRNCYSARGVHEVQAAFSIDRRLCAHRSWTVILYIMCV